MEQASQYQPRTVAMPERPIILMGFSGYTILNTVASMARFFSCKLSLTMFSSSEHHDDCVRKQKDIAQKFARQMPCATILTEEDQRIIGLSIPQLVSECNSEKLDPASIICAYGKRCSSAHSATNCLADIMLDEAIHKYIPNKPLSGVPVSLKDCIDLEGHDTTLGYSANANRPVRESAPIVRLLRDAGALLHVKTTVPTGLFSFETDSDLFGTTTNPYNPKFSPGASTGGGAALLAYQGSKIEVGTDSGGSVRYPAAFCGLYALKSSSGRFPTTGCGSSVAGWESVPSVTSPIARKLEDLAEFWARVVGMKPWEYDPTCVPVPWRPVDFSTATRKPKWGIIWDDGVIPPTPACTRALKVAAEVLKKQGYEVVDFEPPNCLEGLSIGFQLMFADGGASITAPLRSGETMNDAVLTVRSVLQLPLFAKRLMATILRYTSRPAGRNDAWASLIEVLHPKTALEERDLVVQRDAYRAAWYKAMKDQGIDFILTVPHACPPTPKGKTGAASLVSANYAFLYNILDYCAGIVPITHVDGALDALPPNFERSELYNKLNDAARGTWSIYDAAAMEGLPLSVQVVGGRLEEEKVLEGMRLLKDALTACGKGFKPKDF